MKKYLVGFMVGVILTVAFYFFIYPGALFRINLGRLLDRDTFYLKSGQIVDGWILQEDGDKILIEIENGTLTLNRFMCKKIQENTFLRYLRELM